VVEGDPVDAVHLIDASGVGGHLCPGGSWDDIGCGETCGVVVLRLRRCVGDWRLLIGWCWCWLGCVGESLVGLIVAGGVVMPWLGHLRRPVGSWAFLQDQRRIAASSGDGTDCCQNHLASG